MAPRRALAAISVNLLLVTIALSVEGPESAPPPPPARAIPGITAADPFPRACVDCHVNRPEIGLDVRLSTLMSRWNDGVEPKLLARTRQAGLELRGAHPPAAASLQDIPAGCMSCHGAGSSEAPQLSRLMHAIHLSGGDENHFLTLFGGECTHCHKLDATTATWRVPSAAEPGLPPAETAKPR